jgi:dCTP deaminase
MAEQLVTGVYSNRQIREDLENGNIVIDPFKEKNLNGSSYDISLGEHFYIISRKDDLKPTVYSPFDQEHIDSHFEGPHVAKRIGELVVSTQIQPPKNVPEDAQGIILQPGQRILGHTQEFIGIKHGTSSMQARSTIGRNGINVCQDAGWGDPGYINRWTMEIYNNNPEQAILLVVGMRIGQIVFYHTGIVESEYVDLSGNYQDASADNLEELKKIWVPQMMLPKPLTVD